MSLYFSLCRNCSYYSRYKLLNRRRAEVSQWVASRRDPSLVRPALVLQLESTAYWEIMSSTMNSIVLCLLLYIGAIQLRSVEGTAAVLLHRYSFDETGSTTALDTADEPSVTRKHATLVGESSEIKMQDGKLKFVEKNVANYVNLGSHIMEGYASITIEVWFSSVIDQTGNCRIFQFGATPGVNTNTMRMHRRNDNIRFAIDSDTADISTEITDSYAGLVDAYMALTIDTDNNVWKYYRDGTVFYESFESCSINTDTTFNTLGHYWQYGDGLEAEYKVGTSK